MDVASLARLSYCASSYFKHLQHLVAVVVDDLHGDLTCLGLGEPIRFSDGFLHVQHFAIRSSMFLAWINSAGLSPTASALK